MAIPPTNSNSTPPASLTSAQTRALLHALLSSTPNATRPDVAMASRPKPVRPQPVPTQTISIDTSNHIMGHCNTVALASSSTTEQAVKIEQLLRGILQPAGPGAQQANAKANVSLNVTVQAGVSIMGSKNVVTFDGTRDVGKHISQGGELLAGRKRRAESEPADFQITPDKKVKVEP